MIVPSARTAAELKKQITEPVFLVSIALTVPVYISTRGPITYNSITFEQAQLDVVSIEEGDNGERRAQIRVSPAYIDVALSPEMIDSSVIIVMVWGQEPFDYDDGIEVFRGVVSGVEIGMDWIDFECVQINSQAASSPEFYYSHQNILPAGTRVSIRGQSIEIIQLDDPR